MKPLLVSLSRIALELQLCTLQRTVKELILTNLFSTSGEVLEDKTMIFLVVTTSNQFFNPKDISQNLQLSGSERRAGGLVFGLQMLFH